MEAVVLVLAGVAGLALGLMAGLWIGGLIRDRKTWLYWSLNILAVIIGCFANFYGLTMGWFWLVVASLAFIGGSLTGLKYGYGKSVGLWRVHDRVMGSDDLPN